MATAPTKLLTADEFWEFVHRPENDGRFWELEGGEVVEMPSPGERHGFVCSWITHRLWSYVIQRGQGYVLSNDAGIIVRRGPDTVRGPDVMLFLESKAFEDLSPKFTEGTPVLVVEVLSPSDRPTRVNRRVTQYIHRGIRLVWTVDPELRAVTVYAPGDLPTVFEEADELTGGDVLPEFRCRVAELIILPGQA
jgi:Uma2 family endonuclease